MFYKKDWGERQHKIIDAQRKHMQDQLNEYHKERGYTLKPAAVIGWDYELKTIVYICGSSQVLFDKVISAGLTFPKHKYFNVMLWQIFPEMEKQMEQSQIIKWH